MKKKLIFIAVPVILAILLLPGMTYSKNQCAPDWKCADWGECINGVQTRQCYDKNNCGSYKPDVARNCNMLCYNSIEDQDEEGIDCGGVCEPCAQRSPASSVAVFAVIFIICAWFIVVVFFRLRSEAKYLGRNSASTLTDMKSRLVGLKPRLEIEKTNDPRISALESYINLCLERGFKDETIREMLIEKGWPGYLVDKAFGNIKNISVGG